MKTEQSFTVCRLTDKSNEVLLDELAGLVRSQPPARALELLTMLREAEDQTAFWVKDEKTGSTFGPYDLEAVANKRAIELTRDTGHGSSVWSAAADWPGAGAGGCLFTGFYVEGEDDAE